MHLVVLLLAALAFFIFLTLGVFAAIRKGENCFSSTCLSISG